MGLFVKICGLARGTDVEAVAALAPDALGFILWPGSPRGVTAEQVRSWTGHLPRALRRVGVFVDATPEDVRRAVETAGLDVAQLHRTELPSARYLGAAASLWRVVHPERDPAPDGACVDAFVVDTYSTAAPGGTGIVGSWPEAAALVRATDKPVLLAGGLRPDNVERAAREVKPWGVDVSSGVESAPGQKDLGKVREFIQRCRQA